MSSRQPPEDPFERIIRGNSWDDVPRDDEEGREGEERPDGGEPPTADPSCTGSRAPARPSRPSRSPAHRTPEASTRRSRTPRTSDAPPEKE